MATRARPGPFLVALLVLLLAAVPGVEAQSATPLAPRVPILLVPGWSDDAEPLKPLQDRLVEAGWSRDQVRILQFEDPVGSNRAHAQEIAEAVDRLLAGSEAPAVDVVAHSMGGLALRQYLLARPGSHEVRRVVFLGTPHRGTVAAYVAWGEGGREMVPGSDFLLELNDRGHVPDDVRALAIRTPMDLRVIPNSSAELPGVANVEICCPSHEGLLDDEETFGRIRNFLLQPVLGGGR